MKLNYNYLSENYEFLATVVVLLDLNEQSSSVRKFILLICYTASSLNTYLILVSSRTSTY